VSSWITRSSKVSLSLPVFKVSDDSIKLHYTKTEKSIAEELKAVLKNEDTIALIMNSGHCHNDFRYRAVHHGLSG
jgi:hypothetical protein